MNVGDVGTKREARNSVKAVGLLRISRVLRLTRTLYIKLGGLFIPL
jgi:hypothetical protein